jgi:hypothetical protein
VGWNRGALGGTEQEEEAGDKGGVVAPSTGKDDGGEECRRQGADAEGRDDDAAEVATAVERGAEDEEDWAARCLSRWRKKVEATRGGAGAGALGGVSRGWRGARAVASWVTGGDGAGLEGLGRAHPSPTRTTSL